MKPYFETENGKLYHGDCLKIMPYIEPVDLVLTDPPYGINGGKGGTSKKRCKGNYDGSFEDTREYIKINVIPVIVECIKKHKSVILTPGTVNLDLYPQASGFGCFYQPAACGMQHWGFTDSQPILYYGRYYGAGKNPQHVSRQLTEKPSCKKHPCSKPIGAWRWLMTRGSEENNLILDPFFGSGTTAVACEELNRKWIGIEISEKYCEIAARRIEAETKQLRLF